MSESSDPKASRETARKLQPFLDCIAYLLAKRWLREQREQEEMPLLVDLKPRSEPVKERI